MFSLLFVALTGSRSLLKSLPFCTLRRLCPPEEPRKLSSVENMAHADEKIGEEEKHRKADPVAPPSDVSAFTVIREGEAEILMHPGNEVFYNKSQALSASGLRSIRYAREVDGIGQVVALDNTKASVEACRRNIKFNGSMACSKVESQLADARVYMLTHPKEFDVVDLDPYGTPSTFLDSAVQSVVDGGILMCTATDMAVLCGANGEVCYSKYGAYPLRGKYCHEMALRIVLACIESHANRYRRYIVPVLSVQMDFYVRVFVRIYTSASAMKNTPLKLSYVYQCTGCDSFHLQPLGRTVSKVKNHPVKAQPPDQAGSIILAKEPILQANFARAVASLSKAQAKKVARYLPNPERHWGPKVRAGRRITSKHASLLGPEAVNVVNGHEEGDEPPSKRNKTQEGDPSPST
ncbi:putative tRNA (guanine(26)-N(2))-dimethyltransferase 2 [Sesamum angolense]|uniref:tRNA (guanine(26)-N(2))-dimethyltransferase n=1 Tax=Sesamum angolense TaxID=2727404 RepID=A0AAE1XDH0_9LAMI|nr:putative tRNA (guanine(26)-N(2))-dimethyltransferase 2 [Sesamum angolense]